MGSIFAAISRTNKKCPHHFIKNCNKNEQPPFRQLPAGGAADRQRAV
jgi:hypothetical protein